MFLNTIPNPSLKLITSPIYDHRYVLFNIIRLSANILGNKIGGADLITYQEKKSGKRYFVLLSVFLCFFLKSLILWCLI